jgi:hypothetical protein
MRWDIFRVCRNRSVIAWALGVLLLILGLLLLYYALTR